MSLRLLAAIAVALAVLPAAAAEPDSDGREGDHGSLEVPRPDVPTARVASALDGLRRLRLHPARDGFDVTEAAREHPPTNGD